MSAHSLHTIDIIDSIINNSLTAKLLRTVDLYDEGRITTTFRIKQQAKLLRFRTGKMQ